MEFIYSSLKGNVFLLIMSLSTKRPHTQHKSHPTTHRLQSKPIPTQLWPKASTVRYVISQSGVRQLATCRQAN